jgi:geranylgeranyl diphosphate synthase type II
MDEFERWLRERVALVDDSLHRFLPAPERWPKQLHEASCWTLFGGGKRIRPALVLGAFEAVGGSADRPFDAVLPAACAVELVHTYSLVHDDLPAMDDDDQRRGRPTTHVRYGEGMAVLAGDALLSEAFRVVLDLPAYRGAASADAVVEVARELARAAGMHGMVGGQSSDLGLEGPVDDEEALSFLHRRKTGELFRWSAWAGGRLGGARPDQAEALAGYGEALGLAFQVADDLLDAARDEAQREDSGVRALAGAVRPRAHASHATPQFPDPEVTTGSRQTSATPLWQTPSYVFLLGRKETANRAKDLLDRALAQLDSFGEGAEPLRWLARRAILRDS